MYMMLTLPPIGVGCIVELNNDVCLPAGQVYVAAKNMHGNGRGWGVGVVVALFGWNNELYTLGIEPLSLISGLG